MKKLLTFLLAALMLFSMAFPMLGAPEVTAASNIAGGTCGKELEWWLTTEGTLYIEGKGPMDTWSWWGGGSYPQWKTHKDDVKKVVIKKGVTNIGAFAFYGEYTNLKTVTVPATITSIGTRAFDGCTSLNTINIPSKVTSIDSYAFSNCSSLNAVTLPSGLKNLGDCAFRGSGLTSVTVPSKISVLNAYVFEECDKLVKAVIGNGSGSFGIESFTFKGCDNLTTVTMGNAVTYIASESFAYCPKLKNVTIGDNVTHIRSAFVGCTGLEEIFIPHKVEILEWGSSGFYGTFSNCTNLKKIIFGKGLAAIDERSFTNCPSINEIYFCGDAPDFKGTETFKGCTINAYYPNGNSTWKQNKLTNHGGSIDWKKFCALKYYKVNLKVSNASNGKPTLSWEKVAGATKYEVYRATKKSGTYKKLTTTSKLKYTNSGTTVGTTYYYKVRAISGAEKSLYSNIITKKCVCAKPVISISLSKGNPKITWKKVTGAAKYKVYRATSKKGKYSLIKTTTAKKFVNNTAKSGKTYFYKVKAIGKVSGADSTFSNIKSIKAK